MYTVYILYSDKFGKMYTGFTSNLDQRILSHNELGKGYTKRYRPWRLIHVEKYESKKEAMAREKYLKPGVGREWIKLNVMEKI